MGYIEPNSERWLSLEDLPSEEWRDIEGYEGLYQISNYGRVKRYPRVTNHNRKYDMAILKTHSNTKHYLDIELCKDGVTNRYRIHRLVAQAFIPNPNNKPQVNHIDGNKQNNHINNLEWCTNGENQIHAFKYGLNHRKKLGDSPRAKAVAQYTLDGELIRVWDSITRIKIEMNYSDSLISSCCKGRNKTGYGYMWKYVEEEINK